MKKDLIDALGDSLRSQRRTYFQEFNKAEAGLAAMAEEREIELEEHAQEEQAALFLTRYDDRSLQAVKEIDAALQRILDGVYGVCEGCHRAIALARLKALPATRLCKRCAAKSETRLGAAALAVETPMGAAPAATSLPGDLALLDDRELSETIHEHLKEDGRVDLEELHIVCRKGVVYLSGKVPSAAEHQILLHTLTDVLGFKEVIDHLDVEELVWQTERRTKETAPEVTQRWEELPGTEDIVETLEEGKEFVAPAKPTPDEP
jgi:RNA polymerase-binding transcription factor